MLRARLAAALVLAVLVGLPVPAVAIEFGGISARPAYPLASDPRTKSIFIFELNPGQSTSSAVAVTNETSSEQQIDLDAVDSEVSSGGAFACAQESDPKVSVGSWTQLGSYQLDLPAGASSSVPFSVSVPPRTSSGEHDGCITIEDVSQAPQQVGKTGISLDFRTAIRLAVVVPGKLVKKLSLGGIDINRTNGGNYRVTPSVKNTGNVSLDTTLAVSLTSPLGPATASSGGTYPVLPGSTASWNFVLKPPFWGGLYHAQVKISYDSDPSALIGQNIGSSASIQQDGSLLLIPPQPLAAVIELLTIVAAASLLYWYIRFYRHAKAVANHWVEYKVKKKDTLMALATERRVSWRKVARANAIRAPYSLSKGQLLLLPAKTGKK